jgi:hypothetical protein
MPVWHHQNLVMKDEIGHPENGHNFAASNTNENH